MTTNAFYYVPFKIHVPKANTIRTDPTIIYVMNPIISFCVYKNKTMNPETPAPRNPSMMQSAVVMIELSACEKEPVPPEPDVRLFKKSLTMPFIVALSWSTAGMVGSI